MHLGETKVCNIWIWLFSRGLHGVWSEILKITSVPSDHSRDKAKRAVIFDMKMQPCICGFCKSVIFVLIPHIILHS